MQVSITGRHVVVTSALKSFINEKMAKLEEYFPGAKKIQVVLSVEKYRHTAEVRFHSDGQDLSAAKTTKDMYASVEGTVKALVAQAFKRRDKLRSLKTRRAAATKSATAASRRSPEKAEGYALPKVTRMRRPDGRPLATEEAVMALVESGEDFLVYEDARGGKTHVLFKREDGNFGLIEA